MTVDPSDIFNLAASRENVLSPPDQVFKNAQFEFLLSSGGHLADNEKEFDALMDLLKEIGEESFTICENIGATLTERTQAFKATVNVQSTLAEFDEKVAHFDPDFGMFIWHWFVYGTRKDWGIYIAEWPTLLIIGCVPELVDKFRTVYKINGNGYEDEKECIEQEFSNLENPELKMLFLENYKIETTTPQHLP
jgi:hypothetical protein